LEKVPEKDRTVVTYNALITAFANAAKHAQQGGDAAKWATEARTLLEKVPEKDRDVVTYNALITAFANALLHQVDVGVKRAFVQNALLYYGMIQRVDSYSVPALMRVFVNANLPEFRGRAEEIYKFALERLNNKGDVDKFVGPLFNRFMQLCDGGGRGGMQSHGRERLGGMHSGGFQQVQGRSHGDKKKKCDSYAKTGHCSKGTLTYSLLMRW
jgi:hypothetical protein